MEVKELGFELKKVIKFTETGDDIKSTPKTYMDSTNVMAIQTDDKRIQGAFIDIEPTKSTAIENLQYDESVMIPTEYLQVLLKLLSKLKDINAVKVYVKKDYPITFEIKTNEDTTIKCVIAPRIDN